jgi:hypothetical protein
MARVAKSGQSRRRILCALLFILLPACATVPPHRLPLDEILRNREFLARIRAQTESIETLSGLARVRVRTPGQRLAAEEVIRLRVPESLRLELHDPLGGLQLLLMVQGRTGVLVLPGEGRRLGFSPHRQELKRYLGIALTAHDLLGVLMGQAPVASWRPEQIRIEPQGEETVVSRLDGGRVVEQLRLGAAGKVLRWERTDAGGVPTESLLFEDFRSVDGAVLPFRITLRGPDGSEFLLQYRSIHLNHPIEDRLFEAPSVL